MATNAYKGSSLVQRIYHGTAIEYNRHNWNKYSVTAGESKTPVVVSSENSIALPKSYTLDDSAYIASSYWSDSERAYFYFYTFGTGYTYGSSLSAGYVYWMFNSISKYSGDIFYRISQDPNNSENILLTHLLVSEGSSYATYSKGSTSYGIVQGYAGDYPNNGKQGNYWYEKVNT